MLLSFTKMQALGNDFVMIDNRDGSIVLTPEQLRFLADRHFGVGCDQILMVEAPSREDVDFNYRIFNADGGEVGQCGNGARCFARYVRENGLTQKSQLRILTASGVLQLEVEAEQVTVNMGPPEFEPERIPFLSEHQSSSYELTMEQGRIEFGAVSMGNPHICIRVDSIDTAPVDNLGPRLQNRPEFPQGINVGFMQIVNPGHIKLRVFERGVGETLACGSGACAAVAIGRKQNFLQDKVNVDLPGGRLSVQWNGEGEPVFLTGPAEFVFKGKVLL